MLSSNQKTAILFSTLVFFLVSSSGFGQKNNFNPNRTYPPDSLKAWTTDVFDEISKSHPGFYRYTSKERFDFLIDSTNQAIKDSLTELEYYRKLKPLVAQIGCLHTSISLSKAYQDYLNTTKTMLPIEVFINSNGTILISKSYASDANIPIGGKILSINGKPINSIVDKLLKAIPSDGYNQTEKVLLLNYRFSFWYQTIIEVSDEFTINIQNNGKTQEYILKGVSKNAFPSLEYLMMNDSNPMTFEIRNNIGVLKIRSFAKTVIGEGNQNFKKFLKNAFHEMEGEGVKDLIIDLRFNTGGTDSNAAYLASYFFDSPFRYWEKIEVTEAIAKDVKGLDKLFYKSPEKIGELYQWEKTWVTKEYDFYEEQKPEKHGYRGNVYLITNGLCLSSCADFVAILSYNKKAVVIGQETGGGYQGNTSGMMPGVVIPTGLRLTIPLQKYTNAVDLTKNFGRGTIPDHIVEPNFEDWLSGNDVEMEYALKLIEKERTE